MCIGGFLQNRVDELSAFLRNPFTYYRELLGRVPTAVLIICIAVGTVLVVSELRRVVSSSTPPRAGSPTLQRRVGLLVLFEQITISSILQQQIGKISAGLSVRHFV